MSRGNDDFRFGADGTIVGNVSGGCLEADIVARSPDVLASARTELARYDTRASDDVVLGLGLGCQGVIDLLLEPLANEALSGAIAFYARLAATLLRLCLLLEQIIVANKSLRLGN